LGHSEANRRIETLPDQVAQVIPNHKFDMKIGVRLKKPIDPRHENKPSERWIDIDAKKSAYGGRRKNSLHVL
jgi:hypothetical protein